MLKERYWECNQCKRIFAKQRKKCLCPSGEFTEHVILTGIALIGNEEFRFDEQLALTLQEFKGKRISITIREV